MYISELFTDIRYFHTADFKKPWRNLLCQVKGHFQMTSADGARGITTNKLQLCNQATDHDLQAQPHIMDHTELIHISAQCGHDLISRGITPQSNCRAR